MKKMAKKQNKGVVLIAVIAVTVVLTLLGFGILNLAGSETTLSMKEVNRAKAGLDERLFEKSGDVEKEAQGKAHQLLENSDLVLWIADGTKEIKRKIDFDGKLCISVLNKSDLLKDKNPGSFVDWVLISAKNGDGIEKLISEINQKLGLNNINIKDSSCFTERQQGLLEQILAVDSKESALSLISELLNGKVCV